MKRKARIAVMAASIGIVIFFAVDLVCAKVPKEILEIKKGQSVATVRNAVPWLAWDSKDVDRTWLSGGTSQSRLGIKYQWGFSVYLDDDGRVIQISGRSYNGFIGFLDRTYNLATGEQAERETR